MTSEAAVKRVVILDGTPNGNPGEDASLAAVLETLCETIQAGGAQLKRFPLRAMKLAHCTGCFGCWIETPGRCVQGEATREIIEAIVECEMLVLFTPVTFGGYSAQLKLMVDHFIQFVLPSFVTHHGEMHHPPRYQPARFVAVGVQRGSDAEEAKIFRVLAGRNALNFHAPAYAAEVISADDTVEALRHRFQGLLSRTDAWPLREAVTSLMPRARVAKLPGAKTAARRALLIVGSPKVKRPSTSGVLGGYLLERLKQHGWESESWTLKAALRKGDEQARLLAEVDAADLLILAFPLYADSLPFLVTKALQVIAEHRQQQASPNRRPQSLVVLVNNGFINAYQNHVAVAICHQFAKQNEITWAGALAMGAGEALSSGKPLRRPLGRYAIEALEIAGEALGEGYPVPDKAVTLMDRSPFSTLLWRRLFTMVGSWTFRRQALVNGVSAKRLMERPYARQASV